VLSGCKIHVKRASPPETPFTESYFLEGCLNRLRASKLTKIIAFMEGEVSKLSKTVYMSLSWLHRRCTGVFFKVRGGGPNTISAFS
jgi:hypothetical protein